MTYLTTIPVLGRSLDLEKEEKECLEEMKGSEDPKPFSAFLVEKYFKPVEL